MDSTVGNTIIEGNDESMYLVLYIYLVQSVSNSDEWDAWRFQRDEKSDDKQGIYDCIVQYYAENPDPYLTIINNDNE